MMASRYAPQIFWVLATALAYTLLALPVAQKNKTHKLIFFSRIRKSWQLVGFPEWIPTHNTLDWVDSIQDGFKDIYHSFVLQDGPLNHRQEVLMWKQCKYIQLCIHLCIRVAQPETVGQLPEVPWQSWSRAGDLVHWGRMYPECSGSQRTAGCWSPRGGSSGRTRCSSGQCSTLPCRKVY